MLAWVIFASVIAFSLIAIVTTIMIGAKRAPKELPPYLPLLIVPTLMVILGVNRLPVPIAIHLAVSLIGTALVFYVLYRWGPWLKDFYGQFLWWNR